jgi:hypothetical protein
VADLYRLNAAVAAVCPIDGLARLTDGTVRIDFKAAATAAQRAAGQSVAAGWDFSAAGEAGRDNAANRTAGDGLITSDGSGNGKVVRAVAAVLVDEINALRDWVTSFKAAMAAASSLANLQTRVAALASLPDRTLGQAQAAVQAKIDAGTVD